MGEVLAALQIAAPGRPDHAVDATVLVDSGSVFTIVQPPILRRLGLELARRQSLATANDEEIAGDLFQADVRIVPFGWHKGILLFVPDEPFGEGLVKDQRTGGMKRVDGLLGAALLQAGPYLIDFRHHRVARSG